MKNTEKNLIDTQNVGVNETQKEILNLMIKNANITQEEIAKVLGKTKRTIERNISILKNKNIIKRNGSDKKGYWKVNL